jgi:hypothetical protein
MPWDCDAETGTTVRPPRRWVRRIGGLFLVLVVGLVALFFVWRHDAAGGFAAEIAAVRAAGEPVSVEGLNAWPALLAPGENAVPGLRAAAARVDPESDAWKRLFHSLDDWVPALREKEVAALEAVLKENEEALHTLDDAAEKPGVDWALGIGSPMIQQHYPDLDSQRSLADLLRAKAMLEHHRGNDAEAVRRIEQILFVGRAVDHQPTLVAHLVTLGIHARAAKAAAEVAPALRVAGRDGTAADGAATREQVRALIGRLLDDKPLVAGQRRAWVGERVMQIDTVIGLAEGAFAANPPNVQTHAKLFFVRPYFYDNGRAMTRYTTALVRAADSSTDLPSFRDKLPDKPLEGLKSYRLMLARILLPSLDRAGEQQYRGMADRRLSAVALACRLYAVDHDGRLPGKLEDLVPEYLPAVPIDPLAAGGRPLGYVSPEKDPEKPRIYSVGPNGIDQGGAEPDPKLRLKEYEALRDEVRHLRRQPRPEPTLDPDADSDGLPDETERETKPSDESRAPC